MTLNFAIDLTNVASNDDFLHKLMVRELIRDADYGINKSVAPGQWQTNIAVSYQVLCSKTAFICVIKDARLHGSNHATSNVIVPQIQSVDYSGQGNVAYSAPPGGALHALKKAPARLMNMNAPMMNKSKMQSISTTLGSRNLGMDRCSDMDMRHSKEKKASPMRRKQAEAMPRSKMESKKQEVYEESDDDEEGDQQPSSPLQLADVASPANQLTKLNPDLLIAKQNADSGEFSFDQKMLADMFPAFAALMNSLALDQNAFMTLVAAVWLKKYYNTPKYNVITNKAILFLKRHKNVDYKALEPQVSAQL